jgi:hypothetical protein
MAKYKVTVLEHLNHEVTLEAFSEEEALTKARDMVRSGDNRGTSTSVVLIDAVDVEEI